MNYNLRNRKRSLSLVSNNFSKRLKSNDNKLDNQINSSDDNSSMYSDENDSSDDNSSIHSDDLTDIDDIIDDENLDDNLDILNGDSLKLEVTKSILNKILDELQKEEDININVYLSELENKINTSEFSKANDHKNNIISLSALELSNSILHNLISEIRYEYKYNKNLNLIDYIENKLALLNELEILDEEDLKNTKLPLNDNSNIIFKLMIDPMQYLDEKNEETYDKFKDSNDKKFHNFLTNGIITPKDDMKYFKSLSKKQKEEYLKTIDEIKDRNKIEKPQILKIIESNTSLNNKSIIINKLHNFESLNSFSGEYFKLKNWVDGINRIPFGEFIEPPVLLGKSTKSEIKKYLKKVKKHMDDAVYGHCNAKKQILQVIAQTISKPQEGGTIIAIQGPPGVGKTQLIQDGISKALGRPFQFIALGGATDSAYLEGFDYTYEGSRWGKIIDCLIQSKCMNPVIFFDELDKVSGTPKGEEIINILMHLTDLTQNSHYNDKYFQGINFDLSKAIFIFSFNDEWNINKVLKDRMYIIRTKGFETPEKINISKNYLIPKIIKSVGYDNNIIISDDMIEFIIENYTFEGGVRKLKECLLEIYKEINLRTLSGSSILKKKIKFPLKITKKILTEDIFEKRRVLKIDKIYKKPKIGLVNGLWANDLGVGGLIPIEVFSIPTNCKLELELTGQQGDVMRESMRCAKTVAWNIIPIKCKQRLNKEWKDFGNTGIHIHCPDGATPKDGPSAGAAITVAIISMLLKEPVDNKLAMTGEINLKGEVTEIGGLSEKLNGAKKAGVIHVLIPQQNKPDLDKIIEGDSNPLDKNFKVSCVNNIWEVLNFCFKKNLDILKL